MRVGAERHVDDAGSHACDILRAEAERRDGAGTVALHEYICIAQERGQRFAPAGLTQIDGCRQFPPSGVDDERLHRWQVRRRDQQHIGAVRGERATAHRPGDDAREVEDVNARERALGRGQGLDRRVADLIDAKERKASDRAALRILVPLAKCAARGDDEADLGGGGLELFRLPAVERALRGGAVVATAEQGEHPVAVMRQIGVQAQPTAVAAAIEPRDRVVILGRRLSIDTQVPFAAEFDGGAAHVDADTLGAASAQAPQFARCQRGGGDSRLCGGAHAKRGRQHRLGAGEFDRFERCLRMPGIAPDVANNLFCAGRGHVLPMQARCSIEC